MKTLILTDDYESAIVNMALREYATNSLKKAIALGERGDSKGLQDNSDHADAAGKIADRLARA